MKLEPIGDNIIIELDEIKKSKEKTLESGLIIPAANISDQEARQDNKYAGTQLIKDDKTYLILKECDILAIMRD